MQKKKSTIQVFLCPHSVISSVVACIIREMGTSVIDYVFNNLIVTHTDVVNVNALIFFTTRTKDPQLSTAPLAKF